MSNNYLNFDSSCSSNIHSYCNSQFASIVGVENVLLILLIVTGLFVLTLFLSGALLSFGKSVNNILYY